MPAISFQEEWLDKLLSDSKQQTTRQQTDRIKVGDVCSVYNQQRRRIIDKVLRGLTDFGYGQMTQLSHRNGKYPPLPFTTPIRQYPAHLLGKVKITEVFDTCLYNNSARSAWAKADGFTNFGEADRWFTARYGDDWYRQAWTVIRWNGWQERYFEPTQMMPSRGCEDVYGRNGPERVESSK